jgi:serine/threonine protein kinase
LVGFKLAHALSDARRPRDQVDAGRVGIGTPIYMAPEVFAGGSVSPRADVFSLAATLWTLISGRPPVYGEPTPLEVAGGVVDELENCIRAALELVPERRTSSCAAFAAALGVPLAAQQGESLVVSAVERPGAGTDLLEKVVKATASAACGDLLRAERTRTGLCPGG